MIACLTKTPYELEKIMTRPLKSHYVMTHVTIELDNGEKLDCHMFTHGGERAIQDVLNDDRKFFPVEIDHKLKLVSKQKIVLVQMALEKGRI